MTIRVQPCLIIDPATDRPFVHDQRPLAGADIGNRGGIFVISPSQNVGLPGGELPFTLVAQTPQNIKPDGELISVVCGMRLAGQGNNSQTSFTNPNISTAVVGQVEFGTGGAKFFAQFDWKQGVILSVPASFAKVSAFYSGINAGGFPGPPFVPPSLEISASFSYGAPSRGTATRTLSASVSAAGLFTANFQVPDFANSFSMFGRDFSNANWVPLEATLGTTPNAGGQSYRVQNADDGNDTSHAPEQFPLFNGARFMSVLVKALIPNTTIITVVFNLDL